MPSTFQLEKRTTQEILLFVYGTLMRGMPNNDLLADSKFLTEATAEHVRLIDLGYFPGMIETIGEHWDGVTGELWEVSEETLERLDVLEGHPDLFVRSKVCVHSSNPFSVTPRRQKTPVKKRTELVYAYFYNGFNEIHSGDWRQHVEERNEL